jgi:hypothetical protein
MSLTAIELCSAALVKIGARPIQTFDEPSAEAEVAKRLYTLNLDALLSAHPWSFTLSQLELVPEPEAPQADFAYGFTLPADCLKVLSAGVGGSGRGLVYRVQGGQLLANASAITITYQRRVAEEALPAFFLPALLARLAAEFCLPLTEGTARAESLYQLAAAELRLARLIDSQQSTPQRVEDFTLIQARQP